MSWRQVRRKHGDDATMRRVEALKCRVSFADLQRMPDDGNRYELYDGELRVVPSPLLRHQVVVGRLYEALLEVCRGTGGMVVLAPFDIVLTDFDVVQPDLIYFGRTVARRMKLDEHGRFPPDLAIEVLSPSTATIDRGRKRNLLERHRVREYWILDPYTRVLEVSTLKRGRYGTPRTVAVTTYESCTVRGVAIDLAAIFSGIERRDPVT
jgi:Uma2 family endonuclease